MLKIIYSTMVISCHLFSKIYSIPCFYYIYNIVILYSQKLIKIEMDNLFKTSFMYLNHTLLNKSFTVFFSNILLLLTTLKTELFRWLPLNYLAYLGSLPQTTMY